MTTNDSSCHAHSLVDNEKLKTFGDSEEMTFNTNLFVKPKLHLSSNLRFNSAEDQADDD